MNTRRPRSVTPLRVLAETRRLPDHQYMDRPTLDWIASRPPTGPRPPIIPSGVSAMALIPEPDWFASTKIIDGIHGIRHNARVSLLTAVLADHHGLAHEQARTLCAAAACHDCRRRNDRDDPGHGDRAAVWFRGHQSLIRDALRQPIDDVDERRAATAVELHDIDYARLSGEQQHSYRDARVMTDMLKAADALDRYRLPLQRWWPDPARLRIAIPAWIRPFAHDLVVAGERARLDDAPLDEALPIPGTSSGR